VFVLVVAIAVAAAAPVAADAGLGADKARLEVEKLRQEVRKLRAENDRSGSVRESVLAWAPFATILLAVGGVVVPLTREARQQREHRAAELEQRRLEELRRFDELFGQAVANLGSDNESVRVSGAVTLQNFLRPEYELFQDQIYSVLRANLGVNHSRLVNRFLLRAFERAIRLRLARDDATDREPVDLARCRMARANFDGLNLEEADLAFATLAQASLRGARLVRIKGVDVDLSKARLSDADLSEARVHGIRAPKADFHDARLVSIECRPSSRGPADLREAEFFHARLQGAHFEGADLRGAKFDGANVSDASFLGATFDPAALKSLRKAEVVKGKPSWKAARIDQEALDVLTTPRQ
jgi:uncharacterized protein YjbI with pentapeptide repeats